MIKENRETFFERNCITNVYLPLTFSEINFQKIPRSCLLSHWIHSLHGSFFVSSSKYYQHTIYFLLLSNNMNLENLVYISFPLMQKKIPEWLDNIYFCNIFSFDVFQCHKESSNFQCGVSCVTYFMLNASTSKNIS